MAWKMLQPFLNDRVRQKVVFLTEISQDSLAEVGVHLRSMPREWGGDA